MDRPTDVLRAEHQLILRVLTLLETAAEHDAVVPDAWWNDAVAWIREFADVAHHGKEERRLFPALVRAGVPNAGGPVGVMLAEHEQGRALVRTMAGGDGAVRSGAARRFAGLLRAHIDKEDHVLFMIADGVLDEAAQATLARDFEAVTEELGAPATLAHAALRVEALAARLDETVPAPTS